jgi:hypothetical protein
MNFEDIGTDMTNPEHREINCSAYIGAGGKLVLTGTETPREWIDSDIVVSVEDAAELTDEAYTRALEGGL